jgi:SAM-dependent methyltransferase
MTADLLALLRCLSCGGRLSAVDDGCIACARCGTRAPVVGGIPRFVDVPDDATARRTQESFGYEWTHFSDWRDSGPANFHDYFEGVDLRSLRGCAVLDAGCGMGRHARQIAPFAGRVVAIDFSRAIDQAARNVSDMPNVDCVQADLLALPLADDSFDFVYSLGVLHHLEETERALKSLVGKVRPGGRLQIYLYWKRYGWAGRVLSVVTLARRVTTRLPLGLLKALCWVLSLGLYSGVVVPYRVLTAMGVRAHESWPLFVYAKYPFNVLYNDQFDRFSAPLEKRYSRHEVKALLESAGLRDVQVRPCFGWVARGIKGA